MKNKGLHKSLLLRHKELLKYKTLKSTYMDKYTLEELEFLKIKLESDEETGKQLGFYILILSLFSPLLSYAFNKPDVSPRVVVFIIFYIVMFIFCAGLRARSVLVRTLEARRVVDIVIQEKRNAFSSTDSVTPLPKRKKLR